MINHDQDLIDRLHKLIDDWSKQGELNGSDARGILDDLRQLLPTPTNMVGRWATNEYGVRVVILSDKVDSDGEVLVGRRGYVATFHEFARLALDPEVVNTPDELASLPAGSILEDALGHLHRTEPDRLVAARFPAHVIRYGAHPARP